MAKKQKDIFKRTMKVASITHTDILRAEGDDTHNEKATLTDGSGDKITVTLTKVPPGLAKGSTVEIVLRTSQSKLEDHT